MDPKKRAMAIIVSIIGCIAILGTGGSAAWHANAGGFQWGSTGNSTASAATLAAQPITPE
jgi:hypothetical protein